MLDKPVIDLSLNIKPHPAPPQMKGLFCELYTVNHMIQIGKKYIISLISYDSYANLVMIITNGKLETIS